MSKCVMYELRVPRGWCEVLISALGMSLSCNAVPRVLKGQFFLLGLTKELEKRVEVEAELALVACLLNFWSDMFLWYNGCRRRHSYNTKSNKTRVIKTPGGR